MIKTNQNVMKYLERRAIAKALQVKAIQEYFWLENKEEVANPVNSAEKKSPSILK